MRNIFSLNKIRRKAENGLDQHPLIKWCKDKKRFSESYFAVKGAALILPQSECPRTITRGSHGGDIQTHLQSMFYLLRPHDTIKVAVKLESVVTSRNRYMAVVSTVGRQDTEESVILGIDIEDDKATIGLVLPIWSETAITLDGDGGFKVTSNERLHIFKPVSVQAMWSALQSVIKARDTAHAHSYFPGGLTHTWVSYYEVHISSGQIAINEWNTMEDIESHRPPDLTPQESLEQVELEKLIKIKLKEIMLTVDLEEVTSKYLRTRVEEEMGMSLKSMRHFIDEEMIVILRQMDSSSEIFPFLFLGSEWNASNLEELQQNGVDHILNVTREIDNFFPGLCEYSNIRVYDIETAELLKHWDNTFRFINKAKSMDSKVLVHCKMGISRSASTVIAYAMKEYGWSLQEAHDHVKKKRSCIRPNKGFWQQLITYEGILDASKQRNSKLWRSKSAGDLTDASTSGERHTDERNLMDELLDYSLYPGGDSGSRPRSWSPEDSTTQLLMKTHNLASDEDSSDDETNYHDVHSSKPYDTEGRGAPPFLTWDDLDDASSASMDSLMDIVQAEPAQKRPIDNRDMRSQPRVVLLSYRAFSGSEGDHGNTSDGTEVLTEESDFEDFVPEEHSGKVHRGFYDVQMLSANLLGLEVEGQEDETVPVNHINYYLHPDYKMELLMAQQRKHRRIAQLLKLSQPPGEDSENTPPNTLLAAARPTASASAPQLTKLRADNSWIKEIPPSPQDPNKQPSAPEDVEDPDFSPSNDELPQASSEHPAVAVTLEPPTPTPVEPKPEVIALDSSPGTDQRTLEDGEASRVAEAADPESGTTPTTKAHDIGVLQHYQKEDIPWNPGTVKRHKHHLERRLQTEGEPASRVSLSSSDSDSSESLQEDIQIIYPAHSDNTETTGVTFILGGAEMGESSTDDPSQLTQHSAGTSPSDKCTGEFQSSPEGAATSQEVSPEGGLGRPTSIYEIEEIAVEPGVVQRTREELEKRGSVTSQDFDSELKTVQRSASMKEDKLHAKKDRTSERRRTCTPVLRTSSSEPQMTDLSTTDDPQAEGQWLQVGAETIEVVQGKVKKHKRAIESRGTKSECETTSTVTSPESATDDTSPVPDDTKLRSLSLPLDSEAEIPEGAVWKQKMELESRLGSSSTSGYKEPSPPLEGRTGGRSDAPGDARTSVGGFRKDASPVPMNRDRREGEPPPSSTPVSLTSKASISISTTDQGSTGLASQGKGSGFPDNKVSSGSKGVSEGGEETVTDEENKPEGESKVSAYPTEDIPWSVGMVRQQKEAIEKVNASSSDSSRSSSKSPTWTGGDGGTVSLGAENGNLRRTSSCKTPSGSQGSVEGDHCAVGRSASLKESSHGRTELKVSLSTPGNAPLHVAQKELQFSKGATTTTTTTQGQSSKATASKIPAPLEAELEKWSSKKEVLIVEAPKTETKKSEEAGAKTLESAEKLLKSNMKPLEEKTVRDLVGIFDQSKKSPSEDPSEADLPSDPQPISRSKSVSSRPGSEPQDKTKLDRKVSLPVYVSKGPNSQGQTSSLSTSDSAGDAALEKTLSQSPDAKSVSSAGQRSNRIPISPHREPDPEDVPRKSRKLHGKSHPLSKLTAREGSGPGAEKTGRSPNPVYNTM